MLLDVLLYGLDLYYCSYFNEYINYYYYWLLMSALFKAILNFRLYRKSARSPNWLAVSNVFAIWYAKSVRNAKSVRSKNMPQNSSKLSLRPSSRRHYRQHSRLSKSPACCPKPSFIDSAIRWVYLLDWF